MANLSMATLLDAVRQVESGGNRMAVSPAGARGPYQFMPATAAEFGLKGDDVFDEAKSRGAASRKLQGLNREYGGNLKLALAAYNLGQGNLKKVGGDYSRVPETRDYVDKVVNTAFGQPRSSADAQAAPAPAAWTEEELSAQFPEQQPEEWTEEELSAQFPDKSAWDTYQDWAAGNRKDLATGMAMGVARPLKGAVEAFGARMTPENQQLWERQLEENEKTGVLGSVGEIATSSIPYLLTGGMATIPGAIAAGGIGALTSEGDWPERVRAGATTAALSAALPAALHTFRKGRALAKRLSPDKLKALKGELKDAPAMTEGVSPTAAMVSNEPVIRDAETMARLADKPVFAARDEANRAVLAQAIQAKTLAPDEAARLLAELNAQTTPMRDVAMAASRESGGYLGPLRNAVEELQNAPGTRYSKHTPVLTSPADDLLNAETAGKIDPLDAYAYRKELSDALNSQAPMTMDAMTNAARGQRRAATGLKASIDEGLDASSGGKFGDYVAAHREGMIPINEGEAWTEVLKKASSGELAPGVPNVTPAALRRALAGKTVSKSGRDLLTKGGRADAGRMLATANALERASAPRAAIAGSQTTPLAKQAERSLAAALRAKGGTPGLVGDALGWTGGKLSGEAALNEAMLFPSKLPALIDSALSTGNHELAAYLRLLVPQFTTGTGD